MKTYEIRVEVARMDEATIEAETEKEALEKGLKEIMDRYPPGRYCFGEPYAEEVEDGAAV